MPTASPAIRVEEYVENKPDAEREGRKCREQSVRTVCPPDLQQKQDATRALHVTCLLLISCFV
jgi:hypothetical protein